MGKRLMPSLTLNSKLYKEHKSPGIHTLQEPHYKTVKLTIKGWRRHVWCGVQVTGQRGQVRSCWHLLCGGRGSGEGSALRGAVRACKSLTLLHSCSSSSTTLAPPNDSLDAASSLPGRHLSGGDEVCVPSQELSTKSMSSSEEDSSSLVPRASSRS